MAEYVLDEISADRVRLEDGTYYVLLETSEGPEGWQDVSRRTKIWVPIPRTGL